MKSLYLAPGYACNHNCIICPLSEKDRNSRKFSKEEIMEFVEKENLSAGDDITISGGEPTLCEFLTELLTYLSHRKVRIAMFSNVHKFVSEEFTKRIADAVKGGNFTVITALHSARPQIHDGLTGVEGSFEASLYGIRNLMANGIPVVIKIIINKMNAQELPQLAKFIIQNFPPQAGVQFTSMDYSGRAAGHLGELAVGFADIRKPFEAALEILINGCKKPYPVSVIEMPLCACAPEYWKLFRHLNDDSMYMAPNAEEILYHAPKAYAACCDECRSCHMQSFCTGVWVSAYRNIGKDLVKPIQCIL